jgi:peptidoglycan/xylan/chitin deacetylase (PgdA/CDA1 family)
MASLRLKNGLFGVAEACQINAFSRCLCGQSLAVLCYHGVVTADRSSDRVLYGNTVSVAEFESQLEYVAKHFNALSAAELIAFVTEGKRLKKKPIVITFDDGYRNNATHAAEILLRKGIPAVFHLTTGYIGSRSILWLDEILLRILDWPEPVLDSPAGPFHLVDPTGVSQRLSVAKEISQLCKRVPVETRDDFLALLRSKTPSSPSRYDPETFDFMDWDEARRLAKQGFELGSHTVSHPILTGLTSMKVAAELRDSRAAIERQTSSACKVLAYPNGSRDDYSAPVAQEAERAGYRVAFSVEDRRAGTSPSPMAVPRLVLSGHLPLPIFQSKVSGLYSLLGRG